MIQFKSIIFFGTLLGFSLFSFTPMVSAVEVSLDLQDDGKFTTVELPYENLPKQQNYKYKFARFPQGSYGIFNLEENSPKVAVIGPLVNSAAVMVTDGKNFLVFNVGRHFVLDPNIEGSLGQIIRQNLNLDNSHFLMATIHTVQDIFQWQGLISYTPYKENFIDFVQNIKSALVAIGIPQKNIYESSWSLTVDPIDEYRYSDSYLGQYKRIQKFIAVRLSVVHDAIVKSHISSPESIELNCIDPAVADILNFKGTKVSFVDYFGIGNFYKQSGVDQNALTDYDTNIGSYKHRGEYYDKILAAQDKFLLTNAYDDSNIEAHYYDLPFYPIDTTEEKKSSSWVGPKTYVVIALIGAGAYTLGWKKIKKLPRYFGFGGGFDGPDDPDDGPGPHGNNHGPRSRTVDPKDREILSIERSIDNATSLTVITSIRSRIENFHRDYPTELSQHERFTRLLNARENHLRVAAETTIRRNLEREEQERLGAAAREENRIRELNRIVERANAMETAIDNNSIPDRGIALREVYEDRRNATRLIGGGEDIMTASGINLLVLLSTMENQLRQPSTAETSFSSSSLSSFSAGSSS